MAARRKVLLLVGSWQDASKISAIDVEKLREQLLSVRDASGADTVTNDAEIHVVCVKMGGNDCFSLTSGTQDGAACDVRLMAGLRFDNSFDYDATRKLLQDNQIQSLPHLLIVNDAAARQITFTNAAHLPSIDPIVHSPPADAQSNFSAAMRAYEYFNLQLAALHFHEALKLEPEHRKALFNFASILHMAGYPTLSITYIRRLLELEPEDVTAHSFLWALASGGDCTDAAIAAYTVLAARGDGRAVTKLACLTGSGSAASKGDPHYAAQIYDDMADKFESKLVDHLGYRGPWQLFEMLINELRSLDSVSGSETNACPSKKWRMLDLGCGSGLCGRIFAPLVRGSPSSNSNSTVAEDSRPATEVGAAEGKVIELSALNDAAAAVVDGSLVVGVDVSEKMVRITAREGGYDYIVCADLIAALAEVSTVCGKETSSAFDIVAAADTFIYLGELGVIFHRVHSVLRSGGYFLFSTEDLDSSPMRMQLTSRKAAEESEAVCDDGADIHGAVPGWGAQMLSSARFAHSMQYIEALAAKHHFRICAHSSVTLRTEQTIPLPGNLYLLTKCP